MFLVSVWNAFVRVVLAMLIAAAWVSSAHAQLALADLQAKLVGAWLTTVEGEARARNLVIEAVGQKSEGTYLMTGNFYFTDEKPFQFKAGEVLQSSGNTTIVFTTGVGSIYTATAKPDGTFAGSVKYTNGQVKNVMMVKGAAPMVAAAVTQFDGKWSGNAYPNPPDCANGVYELEIKDGRITGTVMFNSRFGAAPSSVTGQVRSDSTAALRLKNQVTHGRSSNFQGKFEKGEFTATDPVASGGRCGYDVKIKRDS